MSNMTKTQTICSRCGGTDNVGPLPKRFACESCGQRGLCYACNVNHNLWCPSEQPTQPTTGVATPGCLCCGLLAVRGAELPCGDCR